MTIGQAIRKAWELIKRGFNNDKITMYGEDMQAIETLVNHSEGVRSREEIVDMINEGLKRDTYENENMYYRDIGFVDGLRYCIEKESESK